MRYTITTDNRLKEVTSLVKDDMRIVYPSDELVDEVEAGYPFQDSEPPLYDNTKQKVSFVYKVEDGTIVKDWTIENLPQPSTSEKRIAEINSLLAESNQEFATFKDTPKVYSINGLKYKPSYIQDYWAPLLTLGTSAFPRTIDDVECVSKEYTFEEFQALYGWLLGEAATKIASVNAYQQPLLAELKELQDGQD